MSTGETLVFVVVIGARFLVPLLIPKFPLPAIIACLVLDAADQSIFQAMGFDPPGYQSYDKAMDVYYLAMAYLSTLRNWASLPAYKVTRFLYFYRLVGVVAFELTHTRALLLVFPNTFEYFFIAYEAIRSRWRTDAVATALVDRRGRLHLDLHQAAAGVVDPRGSARLHRFPGGPLLGRPDHRGAPSHRVRGVLGLGPPAPAAGRPRVGVRRGPAARGAGDHGRAVARVRRQRPGLVDATLEKVVLLGLLSVIFAQTLPGVNASNLQLFFGIAAVVVVNAAFTLALARRSRTLQSIALTVVARTVANVALVAVAEWLVHGTRGGSIDAGATLFFLTMVSLLTTLHDRWYPVMESRIAAADEGTGVTPVAT